VDQRLCGVAARWLLLLLLVVVVALEVLLLVAVGLLVEPVRSSLVSH
jgi:hypothetical protein